MPLIATLFSLPCCARRYAIAAPCRFCAAPLYPAITYRARMIRLILLRHCHIILLPLLPSCYARTMIYHKARDARCRCRFLLLPFLPPRRRCHACSAGRQEMERLWTGGELFLLICLYIVAAITQIFFAFSSLFSLLRHIIIDALLLLFLMISCR